MLTVTKNYIHNGVPTAIAFAAANVSVADMLAFIDTAAAGCEGLDTVQAPKKRAAKKKVDAAPTATTAPPVAATPPTPIPEPVAQMGAPVVPAPATAAPALPLAEPTSNPAPPVVPAAISAPPQVEMSAPVEEVDAMADGWRAAIKNSIIAIKGGVGAARHGDIDAIYIEAMRQSGFANIVSSEQADATVDTLATVNLQPIYQYIADAAKSL